MNAIKRSMTQKIIKEIDKELDKTFSDVVSMESKLCRVKRSTSIASSYERTEEIKTMVRTISPAPISED
jgi:hypothetical protein